MFLPIRSLSFTKAENIWRRPLGCEVLWGMKRLSCSLYFFCLPKIILLVCVLLPLEQTCDRKCRNCANKLHWAYFCVCRCFLGINAKAWDYERFQMLPTRVMCLGMWVRRHLNSCFFPPFYGLQEQIRIFLTDPPIFSILESAVPGQDRLWHYLNK